MRRGPKPKKCSLDGCGAKHQARGFCSPHYGRWQNMMSRCNNPSHKDYSYYGVRGIFVCQGWSESRTNYLNEVGDTPFKGASIDRINNDKGYTCGHCIECVENCWPKNWRWATKAEQNHNRRNPVLVTTQSKDEPK